MRTIKHRLAALEDQSVDMAPYPVWQDGDTQPPIPAHLGDRRVVFVRWANSVAEATPDPSLLSDRNTDASQ